MTETPKTPTPLKQARREKREAKAIKRFIEEYRDGRHGYLLDSERTLIDNMVDMANVRVQVANDALAALKAGGVTK